MLGKISNRSEYSKEWIKESEHLNSIGIYEKLASQIPHGKVLEIGCGAGFGTAQLSRGREVLSLDNNPYLIEAASSYLRNNGISYKMHKCNLLSLSKEDLRIIDDFSPNAIVAWFIGSSGVDLVKNTAKQIDICEKPKLYREKIEDAIVSKGISVNSVQLINFAFRGGRVLGFSDAECFNAQKDDYDTHVFKDTEFEVFDVKHFDWPRDGSNFSYVPAKNPNLAHGEAVPAIISVSARRV